MLPARWSRKAYFTSLQHVFILFMANEKSVLSKNVYAHSDSAITEPRNTVLFVQVFEKCIFNAFFNYEKCRIRVFFHLKSVESWVFPHWKSVELWVFSHWKSVLCSLFVLVYKIDIVSLHL